MDFLAAVATPRKRTLLEDETGNALTTPVLIASPSSNSESAPNDSWRTQAGAHHYLKTKNA
jgi:hypothetical protein